MKSNSKIEDYFNKNVSSLVIIHKLYSGWGGTKYGGGGAIEFHAGFSWFIALANKSRRADGEKKKHAFTIENINGSRL